MAAVFEAAGADASFGARLPGLLEAAGLRDVGAEIHGGPTGGWVRSTVAQLRDHLVGTGLVTTADVEDFLALTARPTTHYYVPLAPDCSQYRWQDRALHVAVLTESGRTQSFNSGLPVRDRQWQPNAPANSDQSRHSGPCFV